MKSNFIVYLALIGAASSFKLNSYHASDPVCPSTGCDVLKANNLKPPKKPEEKRMGNYGNDGQWKLANVTTTSKKEFPLVYPDDALHTAQKKAIDQGMEIPVNLVFLPTGQVLSADDFDNESSLTVDNFSKNSLLAQNLQGAKDDDDATLEEQEAKDKEIAAAKEESAKFEKAANEAKAKADAEENEKQEFKKRNPYDGLVHRPDGSRRFWEGRDTVGGVNDWLATGSHSLKGHWVERKHPKHGKKHHKKHNHMSE